MAAQIDTVAWMMNRTHRALRANENSFVNQTARARCHIGGMAGWGGEGPGGREGSLLGVPIVQKLLLRNCYQSATSR